jgi:hypothetical protein
MGQIPALLSLDGLDTYCLNPSLSSTLKEIKNARRKELSSAWMVAQHSTGIITTAQ